MRGFIKRVLTDFTEILWRDMHGKIYWRVLLVETVKTDALNDWGISIDFA